MSLLTEENYFLFQNYLLENILAGDVVPGTEGLRKIRWRIEGKGKRSGVRIIYYLAQERAYIYLLAIYSKNQQSDLDKNQLKKLIEQMQEWLQ